MRAPEKALPPPRANLRVKTASLLLHVLLSDRDCLFFCHDRFCQRCASVVAGRAHPINNRDGIPPSTASVLLGVNIVLVMLWVAKLNARMTHGSADVWMN